jgi:molybdopterin-guanine dinucleotide biosynthesis protein A
MVGNPRGDRNEGEGQNQMDAVILAGGIPKPEEALFAESRGRSKALIDVAGKPMAQWLLDALSDAKRISNVIVIGVDSSSALECEKPLTFIPDAGGLLDNVLVGIAHVRQHHPTTSHILLCSSDIPTVTNEMIEWRIEVAQDGEVHLNYVVVERATMEERFPGSKRSFIRLQDVEVCGGDLNVLSVNLAEKTDLWDRLIAARKSVRQQAALLGYDLLLRLLTRRITLQQGEEKVSRRLGINGRVVISPYAELAMDVDKPEQLALVRQDLGGNTQTL